MESLQMSLQKPWTQPEEEPGLESIHPTRGGEVVYIKVGGPCFFVSSPHIRPCDGASPVLSP